MSNWKNFDKILNQKNIVNDVINQVHENIMRYTKTCFGGGRAKSRDMAKKMYILQTRKKNRKIAIKIYNKDSQKYNGIHHNISQLYVY